MIKNSILRWSARDIDGGRLCCLGSQLASLINIISGELGEIHWYAADVEANSFTQLPEGRTLELVGNSQVLIDLALRVNQFNRGVFVCYGSRDSTIYARDWIDTEDPCDMDLGNSILEIRAFDVSFFEILTNRKLIALQLSRLLNIGLEPS